MNGTKSKEEGTKKSPFCIENSGYERFTMNYKFPVFSLLVVKN